jgi:hypothetical protein
VFTARYALSPYIKQIRFVFKGLIWFFPLIPVRQLPISSKVQDETVFPASLVLWLPYRILPLLWQRCYVAHYAVHHPVFARLTKVKAETQTVHRHQHSVGSRFCSDNSQYFNDRQMGPKTYHRTSWWIRHYFIPLLGGSRVHNWDRRSATAIEDS